MSNKRQMQMIKSVSKNRRGGSMMQGETVCIVSHAISARGFSQGTGE